ncbi:hypothetical protein JRQ81_009047 [Phrynocephalus forsythii]|uniref:Saccharopine dehydrogenase-like oxidoreductase n=1 Tax=Phrynocephalus forsythii TaxID=171643 RepID=A0A9Q1B7G4_9SAUR|nr:hypothetical protein JRQ81_009047 [Phrynocephalus forsythii]
MRAKCLPAHLPEAEGKTELKSNVSIILCDVGDPTSLANMAKQTSLVLSCVGPYVFFGEPVVKACVENGTSCIDISGESQFLEGMYLNYNDKAGETGAYIIGSCGFDSIPADMGVLYTRDNLKGTLTAVESFFTVKSGPQGPALNDGTWKSAIYGVANKEKLKKIRREIGHKPLPVIGPKLKKRGPVFYKDEFNKYAIPFMDTDVPVVERTQQYLYSQLQETPVQYTAYAIIGGVRSVIKLMFAALLFSILAMCKCGRKLLIKYPDFFSGGFFKRKGQQRNR